VNIRTAQVAVGLAIAVLGGYLALVPDRRRP
jgi:hypothetical protein